jgi:hypothetical protein
MVTPMPPPEANNRIDERRFDRSTGAVIDNGDTVRP